MCRVSAVSGTSSDSTLLRRSNGSSGIIRRQMRIKGHFPSRQIRAQGILFREFRHDDPQAAASFNLV